MIIEGEVVGVIWRVEIGSLVLKRDLRWLEGWEDGNTAMFIRWYDGCSRRLTWKT